MIEAANSRSRALLEIFAQAADEIVAIDFMGVEITSF